MLRTAFFGSDTLAHEREENIEINPDEMQIKVSEIEARSKSNTKRIDKIEKRQDDLDNIVRSVSVMANEQEHIKMDVQEIKIDVKSLTDKPGKRWESIIEKIIAALVGGIVGYLMFIMGLAR